MIFVRNLRTLYAYTQRELQMLNSVEQVKAALNLSTDQLKLISETSGYGCEGFKSAECLGMNERGQFVYSVEYIDTTNGNGVCQVWVTLTASGGMTLEY